ncbi:Predicted flavoprotein CzcO associated with the cation diffusion facilitator CzcD [Saccharopolyspora antimicrobica]|uniref:Flavin-containing monooxygenase 5 n=1 Tax=Saccharopolyspora antimicrobica TaxID=455193 RepID=A0A1I4U6Y0_9PSEU|nr:NAD(P)-binding domain-containing protein [Saccharopolyspora antimicrobica]RKT88714.1 cation diffusion facilitator CzcD-associated flavoprotein CzcO [Saccharopolyspora antimicrobica]SFM84754.1 Predicted flavoprotein CzcO associated with the cation diffusion facilitator CzcD [Saccharopolyspora antimicrobica]
MSAPPRVCVIGAGSSGIATAKVLLERGIPFDCFELSDRIGGNWVWGNRNGISAAYRSLHINTSRERMAFSDFPMPAHLPDFARHDQVAAYFDAYADHFGLREHITFRTGVQHVAPLPGGGFDVALSTGETRRYQAVCVANGHHWDPRWPEPAFPGADSTGIEQIHSHRYTDESQLVGKRVVVVGMGNSAVDIAVDASYHAAATYLSARRGAHIIPKYVFGRPYDQIAGSERIPGWIRWPLARLLLRSVTGRMTRYGLPAPDHKFAQAHPTMSSRVLDRLAHGAIHPKPNIARLDRSEVVFTDGSRAAADLVVYCTGYRISFPFFDAGFLDPGEDNEIRLYQRVFHPRVPGLYFIGLVQPLGAIMPIAERQSELVADHLQGGYALPDRLAMLAEIAKHRQAVAKRYVTSRRHTIQVDFDDYMRELSRERLRGAKRNAPGARAAVRAVSRTSA